MCHSKSETRLVTAGSHAQVHLVVNYDLGSESLCSYSAEETLGENRVNLPRRKRDPRQIQHHSVVGSRITDLQIISPGIKRGEISSLLEGPITEDDCAVCQRDINGRCIR